jgi:hypothetical protein
MKILPALAVLVACGPDHATQAPDAPAMDAATALTISLRTTPFVQAPGETYHCWYFRVDTPMQAIVGFHPVAGAGVHHLALFFEPNGVMRPDRECSTFGQWSLLYGAGVGTGDAAFPDGVAMPTRSDGVYVLQVHILNATDQPLSIAAGVDLALSRAAAAYTRAGMFLAGNVSFSVPAHATNYTVTTACTGGFPAGARLIGLFPHMHKLGVRFATDLVSGPTLYDQPWQFDAQALTMFPSAPAVASTDTIEMRCTYTNPGDSAVAFRAQYHRRDVLRRVLLHAGDRRRDRLHPLTVSSAGVSRLLRFPAVDLGERAGRQWGRAHERDPDRARRGRARHGIAFGVPARRCCTGARTFRHERRGLRGCAAILFVADQAGDRDLEVSLQAGIARTARHDRLGNVSNSLRRARLSRTSGFEARIEHEEHGRKDTVCAT